jgi:endoglucanase
MHTLYAAYEQFKPFYDTLKVDIPESVQGLPALLDESLWNLRWMLTMQDPNDGGVYHKLTHHGFSGSVQPIAATSPRVVVAKGTAATMDFAAVCAQAARVFKPYEAQLPGLADSCLSAAKYAWEWGKKNPNIPFTNPSGISTGEYGDGNLKDEIFWASVELFISTGDTSYVSGIDFDSYNMGIPSWAWVEPMAWLSMARNLDKLYGVIEPKVVKKKITSLANNLYYEELSSGYHISMGFQPDNFVWGSNSVAANIGMVQLTAYELSGDQRFLDGATNNMDYLLGRNPTGYCYVTGFGRYSPLNPHHRPSESDFDPDPVPGFLVGGPHSGQQDNCNYDSDLPALSYTDEQCSYATNEIAINWNAPLTYLSGGLVYYQNTQR